MRKQSVSQITGREGERWFSSQLPAQWSFQKPTDDFGLDGIVAVGTETHITPYDFGVQIKSSLGFRKYDGYLIVPSIKKETIEYWAAKFFPTLLVAYDKNEGKGYFEWVSNLVNQDDMVGGRDYFSLRLKIARSIDSDCWETIKRELIAFHSEFSRSLRGARQIIPLTTDLSALLRNLSAANLANHKNPEQFALFLLTHAHAHIEVIRHLDKYIPGLETASVAAKNVKNFRNFYFCTCSTIFDCFDELVNNRNDNLVYIKKSAKSIQVLKQLTTELSNFITDLLRHIREPS
jgi:hypothetical protein